MRVWLICVIAFFGIAELYQWLQEQVQDLPLPVYAVAGLLLAALSNANRWRHLLPINLLARLLARPEQTPDPDS